MDIHDIALKLYAHLVGAQGTDTSTEDARITLGRAAYGYAEAFIAAKDLYIRELPAATGDSTF